MTIDETIDYYKVDAKENKHLWKVYENYDKDLALMHKEYGERSKRTAEWLTELKERLEHEGTDQTGD